MLERPSPIAFLPTQPMADGPGRRLAAPDRPSLGALVGQNIWELVLQGEPAVGLRDALAGAGLDFVALHGLGGLASRRYLAELAQGQGGVMERLVIRRQESGQVVASLCFVDLKAPNGAWVRVVSTDVASEHGAWKITLRAMLLERARTAVALVGEMPAAEMEDALVTMGRTMAAGGVVHRTLVIQPAYEAVHTGAPMIGLVQQTDLQVRRAGAVRHPGDAWPMMAGTWTMDRSGAQAPGQRRASAYDEGIAFEPVAWPAQTVPAPVPAAAESAPLPWSLATPVAIAPLAPTPSGRVTTMQGLVDAVLAGREQGAACCVLHARTIGVLAQAGRGGIDPEQLVRHARSLMTVMQAASTSLQAGRAMREARVRYSTHTLFLVNLPGRAELWLAALVDSPDGVDLGPFESGMLAIVQSVELAD